MWLLFTGDEIEIAAKGSVFRPDERLSFGEALWMYTVGGSYAANCEGTLGRIEHGAAGDFVLVDPAIIRAAEDSDCKKLLHHYEPEMVVVGGEIIHVSDKATLDILATSPDLHRGLSTGSDSTHRTGVSMSGPFIPGKNGYLGPHRREKPPVALEKKIVGGGVQRNVIAKKSAGLFCQDVTYPFMDPAQNAGNMFSDRPSGSCVCILTGRWRGHGGDGRCGMTLKDNSTNKDPVNNAAI